MNLLFDFFIDFTKNIGVLFEWLFSDGFTININGEDISIIPIGLIIGSVALSIGLIRRIL